MISPSLENFFFLMSVSLAKFCIQVFSFCTFDEVKAKFISCYSVKGLYKFIKKKLILHLAKEHKNLLTSLR